MSKTQSFIKCPNCGTFNSNNDYCKNCGELISYELKSKQRAEQEKEERIAEVKWEMENPNWTERMKNHKFILYRLVGWIAYSAFLVVSAIGSAIAWIVAMVAAG
jgi:ribosomal protein L32